MSDHAAALYLVFPDRAAALAVAAALIGEPFIESMQPDGWWQGTYWCLDDIGHLVDAAGAPLPGYLVNGLWHADESAVPEALTPYRVYPETPAVVWG